MKNPKIDSYGTKRWQDKVGQLHRLDGPAVIYKDGEKWWYLHGVRHRDDGPAIIFSPEDSDAEREEIWFNNGKEIEPTPSIVILLRKKLIESTN